MTGTTPNVLVVQATAERLPLADGTVDLIVTSPPYFALRSYRDAGVHYDGQVGSEDTPAAYLDRLVACTAEWLRVLKPGGSLFVNLGDKYAGGGQSVPAKSLTGLPWRYALRCIDDLGLLLRAEIVWEKAAPMPESVTDRVRRVHEQVFHFTKQSRYYANLDPIREPHLNTGGGRSNAGAKAGRACIEMGRTPHTSLATTLGHSAGRIPGSVWKLSGSPLTVPASLGVDHYAAYPPALVRKIVLGWSPPGGVVLDPFGGSGTTALVASCHGRTGVSVDLSHDYGRVAVWRTGDPVQRARATGSRPPVTRRPVAVDTLGTLFDAA